MVDKNGPERKTEEQPNNSNNLEQSASISVDVDDSDSVDELCLDMNQTAISSNNNTNENHNISNNIPAVIHDQNTLQLSVFRNRPYAPPSPNHTVTLPAPQPCERHPNLGNNNHGISQGGFRMRRSCIITSIGVVFSEYRRPAPTRYSSGPVLAQLRLNLNQQHVFYNNEQGWEQEMNNNVEPPPFYWRRNSGYPWNEHIHHRLIPPRRSVPGCMYFYGSTALPPPTIIFPNPSFGEPINIHEIPNGYCNCHYCAYFQ